MTEFLVVPLKKPAEVDILKPLKNLIQSAYNSNSSSSSPTTAVTNYGEAVSEFSSLRNSAIWKAFEKNEGSLEIIYK